MAKGTLIKALCHLILAVGAIAMVTPFFWMVSTSLKTQEETEQIPPVVFPARPQWGNYVEMWQRASVALGADRAPAASFVARIHRAVWQPFGRCFVNSFLVAASVTAGVLLTSLLAGYAFGRMHFAGQQVLFVIFLATMMIPFEVTLVPNFMLVRTLGLYDTYGALIVPWLTNVFSIFMLRQFFRQIPRDYYDAARIDGCGHWRFLWRIGLPMVAPALVTVGIFSFLGSWNAFLWPLVVTTDHRLSVVQKALATFSSEAVTRYHFQMAASTAALLPIVVAYLFLQRRFVEGVSGVGIRG